MSASFSREVASHELLASSLNFCREFIVPKLFLAVSATLNINLFLHLVHSRACWISLIATSASLYCHTELYNLIHVYVIRALSISHVEVFMLKVIFRSVFGRYIYLKDHDIAVG